MSKTKEELYELQRYVGKSDNVGNTPYPFDFRPGTLSDLVDQQQLKIRLLETKLERLEEYLGVEFVDRNTSSYEKTKEEKK